VLDGLKFAHSEGQPISEFNRDATSPSVGPMGVSPEPESSSAMQFWRFSIHSRRASFENRVLLSDGWTLKSNVSRLLV
jgi:hypothetical protein